jgi:2-isopropylmalate synthase
VTDLHDTTADAAVRVPDLYDTTLRDGTQQEGIAVTVADKLRIARTIDELGVGWIEGGWPGANPKDTEFFRRAAEGELELKRAVLTAFGMTRRPGRGADADPGLRTLLDAGTDAICLVGKSCPRHVSEALGVTLEENVAMVADSVRLLRAEGRRVLFDAEHFFDGHARDAAYALEVVTAAAEAGAECVVLCDTNGGAMPQTVDTLVRRVVAAMGDLGRAHESHESHEPRDGTGVDVGVHVHNDTDCAVANSLVAVRAGASHVQGTVNGIGERCGNANLMSIIPNLVMKLGLDVVGQQDLRHVTHVAHAVAEVMNMAVRPQAPYVGNAAFAHKAGLHVSALAKDTTLYQHVEPDHVGNRLRLLVSELAGRATVVLKGRELGLDLEDESVAVGRVLERVKELEHAGYSFEAADASFELLVRDELGMPAKAFELEGFRCVVERREDGRTVAEATVRLWIDGERYLGVGEGNGPVDALDHAFRAAAGERFGWLEDLRLTDYKVRILDAGSGTGATTRVLIRSSDMEREYETVGVNENIIAASWQALQDVYTSGSLRAAEADPVTSPPRP